MDLTEIYETRMLIFLETEPQSNKYNQIMVNQEQFKIISDVISTITDEAMIAPNIESREIKLSEEVYELPDLKSIE